MGKQQRAIPHGRYRLLDDKRTVRTEKLCAIYIEYSWNSTTIRRTTGIMVKFLRTAMGRKHKEDVSMRVS